MERGGLRDRHNGMHSWEYVTGKRYGAGTVSAVIRMVSQRSLHRLAEQIYDELESVGAELSFSGGFHSSGFSGQGLIEDID